MDGRESPGRPRQVIDSNEATIEDAGATLHSFTAPGADHQIFETKFYDAEASGVRFVDWLDDLISDEPPDDVHCDQCDP